MTPTNWEDWGADAVKVFEALAHALPAADSEITTDFWKARALLESWTGHWFDRGSIDKETVLSMLVQEMQKRIYK